MDESFMVGRYSSGEKEGFHVMPDDVQRLIGALEAQAKAFDSALGAMHTDLAGLRKDVQTLNNKLATLEGGRAALWSLLAAAGIVGGLVTQAVQFLISR